MKELLATLFVVAAGWMMILVSAMILGDQSAVAEILPVDSIVAVVSSPFVHKIIKGE